MRITLLRALRSNTLLSHSISNDMALRQSSDIAKFKEVLKNAKNVVFLSGAGISAESGIPTFRGAGGLWRKYQASSLATPEAFKTSPSLVWEFYHYRREVAAKAQPNQGHIAIANYEAKHETDKTITVITQNVDGLHARVGTNNLIELHGNLYKTRCTKCKEVLVNTDSPICEALADKGAPDLEMVGSDIPIKSLPHCKKPNCNGLLRPHIVWFGENLEQAVLKKAGEVMENCDVCLVVGTSSVVYPAAMFAPQAAARGAIVAEFNLETTPATPDFHYYFEGPCGTTLPLVLSDGHKAIADFEVKHKLSKNVTVITQNVDGLHERAGSKDLVELHGSLFKTRCIKCNEVLVNKDRPICEALGKTGGADKDVADSNISEELLPHCKKPDCRGLLRPHIVWFGEGLDAVVFEKADEAMSKCEVCLVIGTSSLVYPAARFAPLAAARGAIVAEFNIQPTPDTRKYSYYFKGLCAKTLPMVLKD